MHKFYWYLFLFFSVTVINAQNIIHVYSSQTLLPITNVLVKISDGNPKVKSEITNLEGQISIQKESITALSFTHVSYNDLTLTIDGNLSIDTVFMTPLFTELDDIVLTGEIEKVRKAEALYSVDIISEKQLEIRGGNNASEVLKWQQGIQISRDPILGSSIKINGLGGEHVKILVDGVELNGRSDGFVDLEQIQTQENQHVEIVKGPVSLEYGSNALGGVIQFISTDVDIRDSIGGSVNLLAENTGTYRTSFHLVEAKKKHSLNLYFNRTYFDGWKENDPFVENFKPEVADSSRNDSWNPKRTINGKVKYDVNIFKGRFTSQLFYQNERITEKGLPFISPTFSKAKDALTESERFVFQSTYKGLFNKNHHFKTTINLQNYQRDYSSYILDLNTLIKVPESESTNITKYKSYQGKFQASILSYKNHKLSYGGDFLLDEIIGERILHDSKTQSSIGFWIKDNHQINDDLKIQPGLRVNIFSPKIVSFTPSINFHYNGLENSVLRLSLSKGFRNPGLKDKFFEFIDSNHHIEGNEELQPEKSYHIIPEYNKEISDRVNLNIGLFYNLLFDKIALIQSSENPNWYTYSNFAKYQGFGGSTNITYKNKTWILELGYQLTADRVIETSIPKDIVKTHQLNLSLNKTFGDNHIMALNIKWDSEKSIYQFDSNNQTVRTTQESFTFADVSHHYQVNPKLKLSFWIKNIFDITSVRSASGSAHSTGVNNIARGRLFQIQLKYKL